MCAKVLLEGGFHPDISNHCAALKDNKLIAPVLFPHSGKDGALVDVMKSTASILSKVFEMSATLIVIFAFVRQKTLVFRSLYEISC